MKRKANVTKITFVSSVFVSASILSACGSGGSEESSGESNGNGENEGGGEELVLATINPEGSLLADSLYSLADEINETTNGEVQARVSTGGELGDASGLYQSVSSGDIDMIYSDTGFFAEQHPEFNVLGTNYLFEGESEFKDIVNTEGSLDYFDELLKEDPGLETIMHVGGLERNIISTYPIEEVGDLDGRNMRSKNESTEINWWEDLGANPVPVAFDEVYTSIQTGVVEGSQNSFDAMIQQRFGEVADHVSRTQHNFSLGYVVMNNETFESFDSDTQQAILEAGSSVQEEYINKAFEQNNQDAETLKEEFGVEIIEPNKEGFQEASANQRESLIEEYGIEEEINNIFEEN